MSLINSQEFCTEHIKIINNEHWLSAYSVSGIVLCMIFLI